MRRTMKTFILGLITILGVVVTGCGPIVYDDRPCPPPSSHVYVVGPSRYYYPSGHPYYKPYPGPRYKPTPPPPKSNGRIPPGGNKGNQRPPAKRK